MKNNIQNYFYTILFNSFLVEYLLNLIPQNNVCISLSDDMEWRQVLGIWWTMIKVSSMDVIFDMREYRSERLSAIRDNVIYILL